MKPNRHRSEPSSGHPWLWHVPSIVLAIVVLASPLAIGGVHASVAAALAGLSIIGLWTALLTGSGRDRTTGLVAFSIPAVGFAVMALVCLVQLIPIPTSLYRVLQPTGFDAWTTNGQLVFGHPPDAGLHLLSMDPRATSAEGLRWLALASATALAGWVITDRHRRRLWLGMILIGGLIVAAVGTVNRIISPELFLGFYEAELSVRGVGPFVSTNHLASFYGLLAVVGAAWSMDHLRRSPPKASLGAGATLLFLLLCASHGSDGALVATAVGLVVVAVAAARRFASSDNTLRRRIATTAPGILLIAALAAMLIPTDWTFAEDRPGIDDTSAEVRITMMEGAISATPAYPFVGSGAGSVERTIAPYMDWTDLRGATVHTIENQPVEWFMTMGPAVGALAIILFLVVVARLLPHVFRRRNGRRGAITAVAILLTLGVISLFHFPFMALGIALVAAVAVEACLDSKRDPLFVTTSPKTAAVYLLGLTVAVAGLVTARVTVLTPGAEADLQLEPQQRVERALHLYPTDGRLMSALSLQAREDDPDKAQELARQAFELRPMPQQQTLLARSLGLVDETEEAAALYADLIDADRRRANYHFGLVGERIRHDIRRPAMRAAVMADTTDRNITRFHREIVNEEGRFPAIEFHLELIEQRPDRVLSHLKLIDLYRDVEQELLAEVYARNLVDRNLVGPDGERPAGLVQLLKLLDDQGRTGEARNMADRAFDAGLATPELARTVLSLMPGDPDELHDDHRPLLEAAVSVGCRAPYEGGERRICWRKRALVAEADDNVDRAESLLRRIERVYDDPRPLIRLLRRHRNCRALASLERRYEGKSHHSRIERALDSCIDYSDEFE